MRIIFICRANVGRSQMAAALYLQAHSLDSVISAGTQVDRPGETLAEYSFRMPGKSFVVATMDEVGADLRASSRTQLTAAMLSGVDVIVSMAELTTEPSWLTLDHRYRRWAVPDPGGESLAAVRACRELISRFLEREFPIGESRAA